VPHDVRDQVIDFARRWSEKTEISVGRLISWLGVTVSKFYNWRQRYGRVNEHNGWVPRDFWLEPWEKEAIIGFPWTNPLEGYRRLTFMMLDHDVVAVSPASVWRVLKQAGLLSRWKPKPSRKGTGFEQPLAPHQHWHVDVSYINLSGTFYYGKFLFAAEQGQGQSDVAQSDDSDSRLARIDAAFQIGKEGRSGELSIHIKFAYPDVRGRASILGSRVPNNAGQSGRKAGFPSIAESILRGMTADLTKCIGIQAFCTPEAHSRCPVGAADSHDQRVLHCSNGHVIMTILFPPRGDVVKEMAAGTFKAQCLAIMDQVLQTGEPVLITKYGRPVAKLVPAEKQADDIFGYMTGKVKIVGDIVGPGTPLEDWECK